MNAPAPLQPSPAELTQFVEALFPYADPDSYISLRVFDQKDSSKPAYLIEGVRVGEGVSHIVSRAVRASMRAANSASPGVFAPPVATFKGDRSAADENIANGVAISVELDEGNPAEARRRLEHILGPVTIAMHSGSEWLDPETGEVYSKAHFHWRLSEPTRTPKDHADLREARWCAGMLVGGDKTAFPVCHPLRWPGSWNLKRAPRMAKIAAGNLASEVHLQDALEKLQEAVELAGIQRTKSPHIANADPQARIEMVASALAAIPNDDVDWHGWNRLGMAAWRASGGSTEGFLAWSDWSAKAASKHDEGACSARWTHYSVSPPTKLGAGTIFYMAAQHGWARAPIPVAEVGMDERPIPPWETYIDGDEIKAEEDDPAKPKKPRIWVEDQPWDEAAIPKRPWIAPGFLMRRALTVLSGPGSAGKSSVVVAWTCTLALGMEHGRFHSDRPMRCLSYNVEDDREEQLRRYSATARQFGKTPADMMQNLRIVGPTEVGTLLRLGPTGVLMVNTPVMDALEKLIAEYRPDAVFLDPFVELHSSEENDNTAVRQVLARFRGWAAEMNMAVCILHHARKGAASPGDPDSMRGASAIVGAARIALTLNVMGDEDADSLGIPKNLRRDYFRMDGAKMNYSRVQDADWYERVEYELDNGERIAAAVPWMIKTQTLDPGHIHQALSVIERGSPFGPWSAKLSKDDRSIKRAFEAIGVTTAEAQRELLAQVLEVEGVESVMFRDAARTRKMGLRGLNGPRADWVDVKS